MRWLLLTLLICCLPFKTVHGKNGESAIISRHECEFFYAGYATWFSQKSCLREGNTGITACGKLLDDSALWCALPLATANAMNLSFGQSVKVINLVTGKSIVVKYMDTGPGRRAQSRGVIVDLTKAVFRKLAELSEGRIRVRVENVK